SQLSLPSLSLLSTRSFKTLIYCRSQPVVASGGFSTAAAAGCLSSSLCFPLLPCLASFFLSLAPPISVVVSLPSPASLSGQIC
ncbi:unnamed protein product, partial [Brassica rapa subsp. narinosa]